MKHKIRAELTLEIDLPTRLDDDFAKASLTGIAFAALAQCESRFTKLGIKSWHLGEVKVLK